MKVAFYLGSFNPFHKGHLNVIRTAFNNFKMDRVIIVPTMQNPAKKEKALDINKRVEIICDTFDRRNQFRGPIPYEFDFEGNICIIDLIEKALIPPYFSYATLHALKNKYCNDEVYVLCGEDTINSIPDWMHGGKIIEDYDFLVVDRPANAISSTQIREILRTRNKMDAYYLDTKLVNYVSPNAINLLKLYY